MANVRKKMRDLIANKELENNFLRTTYNLQRIEIHFMWSFN